MRNYLLPSLALAVLLTIDCISLEHGNARIGWDIICRNCLAKLVPGHQELLSAAIALAHLHHLGLLAQVMDSLPGTTTVGFFSFFFFHNGFLMATHTHTHKYSIHPTR